MDAPLVPFALMVLVVVITPGPTVLLALSNGSRYGFLRGGVGIVGAALSDCVLIAAAGIGLGAALLASGFLFTFVKGVGVVYLIWLGIKIIRSSGDVGMAAYNVRNAANDREGQSAAIFRKSFLVAVTNPKGYLFFATFLPQFLTMNEPMLEQYVTLAVVFVIIDVLVMAAYACLGVQAVQILSRRGAQWIDRVCGGMLVLMGIGLAFVRRGTA